MNTLTALLSNASAALASSSTSPRADAMLLLERVLRRERTWIVSHGEITPLPREREEFAALCQRRAAGVPVAYLTGSVGFYGREFVVDPSVLVPRPETEHLVDEAIGFINGSMRALDVGTGCGGIACTIAAETGARVDATDNSPAAIEIARENAGRLGVAERCSFYQGDLVDPVSANRYDVVIANLPYIPTADLPRPPDPASFEPRDALNGGPDGLALYRRLLPELPRLLNEGAMLLLECAPPTIAALQELVSLSFPNFVVEGGHDYAGLARYVKAISKRPAEATCRRAAYEAAAEPRTVRAAGERAR